MSATAMVPELSPDAITTFFKAVNSGNEEAIAGMEPVLQVLSVKKVPTKPAEPPRNRIILSDGTYFTQAMLATQHNDMIEKNEVTRNCVVRLKKFHASKLSDQRSLIVVLELDIEGQAEEKIGNPQNIDTFLSGDINQSGSSTTKAPVRTSSNQVTKPAAGMPRSGYALYPIDQLSPYQNKWAIKARVTNKSDIKNYATAKGDGKLFGLTLVDESGEIRATAFNERVDELYDKFEENKVYYISKAKVNIAKRKWGNATNDFEIALEKGTEVDECQDPSDMPEVKYTFVELGKLEEVEKDAIIDVVGIVTQVGDVTTITSKAGKTIPKRDVTIVDRSQASVRLTFWGKQAESFSAADSPVIAFKGVRVGDFNGRSLSMVSSSQYQENPSNPEANLLRGWYDAEGRSTTFHAQSGGGGGAGSGGTFKRSEIQTLNQIKESGLGQREETDFFSCRGTIIFIKSDTVMYTACPTEKCNKKVTEGPNGDWRCEKCDRSFPEPEHRYLMSVHVADHTNQLWLQAFNDVGEVIMGMPAKELYEIEQRDHEEAQRTIAKAHCKSFNFACRGKQDNWGDQIRTRYGINKAFDLDFAAESQAVLEMLKAY